MKQQIPRSAREALARQTAADEHPSADLLNGFVEHALGADENARVITHLSACADCREIVFLASSAAEDQQVAVAAAQSFPSFAAASVAEAHPTLTSPERPRFVWLPWKWLVPAVAALALITIVVVHNVTRPQIQNSQMVAMNAPSSLPATPAQTNALSATVGENDKSSAARLPNAGPEMKSKAAEVHTQASAADDARRKNLEANRQRLQQQQMGSSTVERNAQVASPQSTAAAPPNAPPGASAGRAAADAVTSSKLRTQGFARPIPQQAKTQSAATSAPAPAALGAPVPAAPQVTAQAETPALSNLLQNATNGGNDISYIAQTEPKAAPPAIWRITDDGHLQRATASGQWTPMLTDQAVFFHSVAVVGGDVWAGGSDGALFHSGDNGEHWTRVAFAGDGQAAHGSVRSIRFSTPTAGQVITDAGETWSTSDGGKTWTKN